MNLIFKHPRNSSRCEADVPPSATGRECIEGLLESNFLQSDYDYRLQVSRTGSFIQPNERIATHQVLDGEIIDIHREEHAAISN